MENKSTIHIILKSLLGTAGIFVVGMFFSFTFNWAITKYMDQDEVGLFQYYISIITFAMVIIPLGYQSLAQREALSLGRNGISKLSKQALLAVFFSSVLFGGLWYWGLTKHNLVKDLTDFSGLKIALMIIPVYALNVFFRAILQSQNKIFSSVLPDVLIRPIILLGCTMILPLFAVDISGNLLLWILLFILVGALIFSIARVYQHTEVKELPQKTNWLKQALLLLPIGLLTTVNERIDVVMVSKILGKIDNAVYGIAFKFALFSGFGLVILNQVLVPHYAKYFSSEENSKKLREKIKPNVRLSFALSSFVVLSLIVIGQMLLSWFGKGEEDYTVGYSSMIILAFGQLFNVALGSTGYILTMAKKESLVMLSIVAGIVVNILLNYLLLPTLGITGAAISTSASIVVWNLMMLIFVKRTTGINPTIF